MIFSITNCFLVTRIYWGQDISFTFWLTLSKLPNFTKEMHKESSALYISLLAPSFGSLGTLCALYLPCLLLWLAKHFVCFICIACLCGLLSTLCAMYLLCLPVWLAKHFVCFILHSLPLWLAKHFVCFIFALLAFVAR